MSHWVKPPLGALPLVGHPMSTGLVGLWLMNEGGGTIVQDLSGYRNHGTVNGTSWVGGRYGPALGFGDANTDYVNIGTTPAELEFRQKDYTVLSYVYPNVNNASQFLAGNSLNENGAGWGYYLNSSAGLTMWHQNAFDATTITYAANKWQWVGYAYTNVTKGILWFLDGAFETDTQTENAEDTTDDFVFGIDPRDKAGVNLNGNLSMVFIWDRPLEKADFIEINRNPFGMFDRDEIGLWVGSVGTGAPPVGNAAIMTTNTGFWGATF